MVRFKNRWLLLSLEFPSSDSSSFASTQPTSLTSQSLTSLVRRTLTANFGVAAAGALGSSLAIKYYSPTTHLAILRCPRIGAEQARAAATLMTLSFPAGPKKTPLPLPSAAETSESPTEVEAPRVIRGRCRVIAVSGTIKKLQERIIRGDRRFIHNEGTKAHKRAKRGGKAKQKKERQKGGQGEARRGEGEPTVQVR